MVRESRKLIELEAVRGLAAIAVLVHHFMLGFTPRAHGLLFPSGPDTLLGTPAFALVNGSAMVVLFFVLSGFVLTVRPLETGRPRPLLLGAAKRWPRLALPVFVVSVISGVLAGQGWYVNAAASGATGSPWLGWFFTRSPMPGEVAGAAVEGLVTTFLTGSSYYNSNLWTMRYEFLGSFLALGVAAACIALHGRTRLSWGLLAAAWIATTVASPYYGCFVLGVAGARLQAAAPGWTARAGLALPLALIAFLLAGYHESLATNAPTGWYAVLDPLARPNPLLLRVVLHSAAAIIVIGLVTRVPWLRRVLSGRVGAILGALSFPIYLTHIVVICSLSSWLYLHLLATGLGHGAAIAATFVGTALATLLASIPLGLLDHWWVATLRRLASRAGAALARSWRHARLHGVALPVRR